MADPRPERLTTPVRVVVTRAGVVGPPGRTGPPGPPGIPGQQGADGEDVFDYEGTGPPGLILGAEPGQTYLDLSNGDVYVLG